MKRYLFISILFICTSLPAWATIYFRHLDKTDGLSQLSVMSICQDELGRMWFGTLEGLNCYDGMQITRFKYSDQYPMIGNETFHVVSNKKGSLFFTSDNRLLHFDIYQEKFTQLRKKGNHTLFAHNNRVLMATNDSIFEWNQAKKEFEFFLMNASVAKIKCLSIDHKERLWIGTQSGLYRFDDTQTGSHPLCIIPRTSIRSLYNDSHNNMWVALVRNGMYKVTPSGVVDPLPQSNSSLSNNDVRSFVEDNTGNLWIATFNGLNKMDVLGNFTHYMKDNLPSALKHSSIFPLYKDTQGTIWLGSFFGGVQYFNPEADLFTHYSENKYRDDCLNFFFVGKMVEDKRGDIWVCTEGGGLNKLNRKTKKFAYYTADGKANSIPFNNLKCITYDEKRDCLYIGTHTKGLFKLDITTGKITRYNDTQETGTTLIYMILHEDKLFLSSEKGLKTMDLNTDLITDLFPKHQITQQSNVFFIDSKDYLWIAQYDRLLRINLKNTQETYSYWPEDRGLGKSPIMTIIEDRDGTIVLGTNGSGLFSYNEAHDIFTPYTTEDGWNQSNYCYEMKLSAQGKLVVAGEQGVTLFDPKQKTAKIVDLENNLCLSALSEGCGILICRNGEIFVSGTDGMTSFMENELLKISPTYNLYFSSIAVNNQLIDPNTSDILSTAIPFSTQIELQHNENDIMVTFTSNNYIRTLQQKSYEYMLKGFDERWITSTDNKIVYTNLSPGKYTLIVREKRQDGAGQSIRLHIRVHSPWYDSWVAYIIYALILAAIAYAVIRNRRSKMLLQISLEREKREKEKNEEVTQAKLQFFSNISHEFRTPLTLIISQIAMLLQHRGVSPFVHTRLLKIHRSTFQLKELVSELLDFRKMEQGGMKIKVSPMNLIPFLKSIHQEFQEQATLQQIDFRFESPNDALICWYDAKQLKRVIFNLLSNAFKHTPPQGKIELTVEAAGNCLRIKVIDNGQGISEEALPHIFDRFYQASNSSSKDSGTGIGLSLVKGLVTLHHGTIEVHSALHYGTIFTVELPKENVFKGDIHALLVDEQEQMTEEAPTVLQTTLPEEPDREEPEATDTAEDTEKPHLLLVEDNEELLQVLTELLSPLYRVSIAFNGKDGLDRVIEEQPDLILSDIMMPVMSGIELCMKVKNNFDLCHIPVILLTALTAEDKNIEGLQCGADDYIGKPFNNKILISKIAGILRTRSLLKKKYSHVLDTNSDTTMQELALTPIDKKFLVQLNQIIENHLSDSEFDVNTMAKELGVSRSSLYNKLKGLSCMTPNEFVLQIRLKRAADMLKNHPELQITEIAYQLGFNSLRYFRHCFKAQFNQTPQEFRNK